jgi:hypothetical protein
MSNLPTCDEEGEVKEMKEVSIFKQRDEYNKIKTINLQTLNYSIIFNNISLILLGCIPLLTNFIFILLPTPTFFIFLAQLPVNVDRQKFT